MSRLSNRLLALALSLSLGATSMPVQASRSSARRPIGLVFPPANANSVKALEKVFSIGSDLDFSNSKTLKNYLFPLWKEARSHFPDAIRNRFPAEEDADLSEWLEHLEDDDSRIISDAMKAAMPKVAAVVREDFKRRTVRLRNRIKENRPLSGRDFEDLLFLASEAGAFFGWDILREDVDTFIDASAKAWLLGASSGEFSPPWKERLDARILGPVSGSQGPAQEAPRAPPRKEINPSTSNSPRPPPKRIIITEDDLGSLAATALWIFVPSFLAYGFVVSRYLSLWGDFAAHAAGILAGLPVIASLFGLLHGLIASERSAKTYIRFLPLGIPSLLIPPIGAALFFLLSGRLVPLEFTVFFLAGTLVQLFVLRWLGANFPRAPYPDLQKKWRHRLGLGLGLSASFGMLGAIAGVIWDPFDLLGLSSTLIVLVILGIPLAALTFISSSLSKKAKKADGANGET